MRIENFLRWSMAICSVLIFLLAMTSLIHADDNNYIQQSNVDPRKAVIYGDGDKSKGYLQQSPVDPRKTIQYDKNGNVEGYWQKSNIDPRKTVFQKKD